MDTTKDKSCEERIDERMANRLAQYLPDFDNMSADECRQLIEDTGGDADECYRDTGADEDDDEDTQAEHWREAAHAYHQEHGTQDVLSVDKETVYKVCLSWGGPSDYFHLYWDGEGWTRGEYKFQDWFDGATRSISAEQAERLAEVFGIYPDGE